MTYKQLLDRDHIRQMRQVVRDALEGDLAVRARGQEYLPKLEGQTDVQYKAYSRRGTFPTSVQNTLTTLLGTALSKPPEIELPEDLEPMIRTCGIRGEPLINVIEEALAETLSIGQIGLHLHHPGGLNVTPRIVTYHAETIKEDPVIEWRDGVQVLTKVVVEDGQKEVDDGIRDIDMTLYINDEDDGQVWIKRSYWDDSRKDNVTISDMRYDVGAYPLKTIPFVFCSYNGIGPRTVQPPFYGIARMAINAWITSTEKRHLLHIAGHPQYWISGPVGDNQVPDTTGPGTIWNFPPDTRVGREQADSGSTAAMQAEIDAIERQIQQQGGSFMGAGTKDGVASSTNRDVASMKLRGQMALLHQCVNNVEEAFKRLFEMAIYWQHGTTSGQLLPSGQAAMEELTFSMNRQFIEDGITPAMAKVLHDMVGMQYLSPKTLYYILQRSGLTIPGVDHDQEMSEIEHDPWMTRGSHPDNDQRLDDA